MGFISFNENYYRRKQEDYENKILSDAEICGAKQLLKALDDRVEFRLFTTVLFLYETYQGRVFCRKYEDIRRFETLYSQDLFMQYSSYRNGKFYVNVSAEESVKKKNNFRNSKIDEVTRDEKRKKTRPGCDPSECRI